MTPEEQFAEYTRIAARLGRYCAALSGGVIDAEDGRAETLMWMYANQARVERSRLDNGRLSQMTVADDALRMHLRPWIQREVTRSTGRDPRDQLHYTRERVRAMLPYAWGDETPRIVSETGIKASKVASRGGGTQAVISDLRAGRARLSDTDEAILFLRHVLALPWAEVAGPLGLSEGAAKMREQRGVDNIVDYLNGLHPVADEGPGTREVMSNERAQVVQALAF